MKWLISLVIIKALLALLFVLYGPVHLSPDEAQYWLWSHFLDIGYYSKPPGIAWQIFLGRFFLGDTELGVRIGAIIFSSLLPLAVYHLAKRASLSRGLALLSAVTFLVMPISLLSSFVATTDGGFVFFWVMALGALISRKNLLLVGFYTLLGALFKWNAYLIWPIVLFFPNVRWKDFLYGFLLSLIGLLPSFIWNFTHDFVTFRHVLTQSATSGSKPNVFEFFFSQVGLLSPLLFIFLIISFFKIPKMNRELKLITLISLFILTIYTILSCFQKIQANWAVFLFPLAAISIASAVSLRWLILGWIVALVLAIGAFALPFFQEAPYALNLFQSGLGWPKLESALQEVGYDPKRDFLVADHYQMASILSFYSPGKKRAYFLNLQQHRLNQFSFWPQLQGSDGFFVTTENAKTKPIAKLTAQVEGVLAPYFDQVHLVKVTNLYSDKKIAYIFKVSGYNGKLPLNPEKY